MVSVYWPSGTRIPAAIIVFNDSIIIIIYYHGYHDTDHDNTDLKNGSGYGVGEEDSSLAFVTPQCNRGCGRFRLCSAQIIIPRIFFIRKNIVSTWCSFLGELPFRWRCQYFIILVEHWRLHRTRKTRQGPYHQLLSWLVRLNVCGN